MSPAGHGGDRLVRTYVVTGGRDRPSRSHIDHITLITLTALSPHLSRAQLNPEQLDILEALSHSCQSVAELGAVLGQPVSVMRILIADLMEADHVTARQRITDTTDLDRTLLEDVLAGLKRL
ncbi:DUF742 domain-containing protein [Streptomyces halstedii]|uniref:DUF742 domain-containing protein n=1 Tax=Streptomyces halstedii TaxID=1944 RepID=A0A6N9UID4_STRHA|nr:DUF742 domain-containing protein [Streptomyces halstedii]NEA20675.1 DUF742 domain-containing protein [Streptomyces halstedii]